MNKKGMFGIGAICVLIVFGLVWITGLSPLLTAAGKEAVLNGSEGFEAFFYTNLNGLVGFFYLLAWAVTIKYGIG